MNATKYILIIGLLMTAAVARAQMSNSGTDQPSASPVSSAGSSFNATATNALGSPSSETIRNTSNPSNPQSGSQSGLSDPLSDPQSQEAAQPGSESSTQGSSPSGLNR